MISWQYVALNVSFDGLHMVHVSHIGRSKVPSQMIHAVIVVFYKELPSGLDILLLVHKM